MNFPYSVRTFEVWQCSLCGDRFLLPRQTRRDFRERRGERTENRSRSIRKTGRDRQSRKTSCSRGIVAPPFIPFPHTYHAPPIPTLSLRSPSKARGSSVATDILAGQLPERWLIAHSLPLSCRDEREKRSRQRRTSRGDRLAPSSCPVVSIPSVPCPPPLRQVVVFRSAVSFFCRQSHRQQRTRPHPIPKTLNTPTGQFGWPSLWQIARSVSFCYPFVRSIIPPVLPHAPKSSPPDLR